MAVVVLFHALLALLPWQSWAQGPQILGVGGNLTVYSPDFVNVQASAGNVTLQSSEYVNIVSPAVTLSGTLSVSTAASSGNLTVTAGDFLALSAPAVVLSGTTVSSTSSNFMFAATQSATVQGSNIYLNGPVQVAGSVSSGTSALTLESIESISASAPTLSLTATQITLNGPVAATSVSLTTVSALTNSNLTLQASSGAVNVIAPKVVIQGTLSASTVAASGNLSLSATQDISVLGTTITLSAPLKVAGWIDAGLSPMSLTSSQSISLIGPTVAVTTTNGNVSLVASQSVTLQGTTIQLTAPVLSVTVAQTIDVAVPVVNIRGRLVVSPANTVISVFDSTSLLNVWVTLLGQPLSSPVIIQLTANYTDTSGELLILSDQPYGKFITIQGLGVPIVTSSWVISNVQQININGLTFFCPQTTTCEWPALSIVSGASANIANATFLGAWTMSVSVGGVDSLSASLMAELGALNPNPPSVYLQSPTITSTGGIVCSARANCIIQNVNITHAESTAIGVFYDAYVSLTGTFGIVECTSTSSVSCIAVDLGGKLIVSAPITVTGASTTACISENHGSLVNLFSQVTTTFIACQYGVSAESGAILVYYGPIAGTCTQQYVINNALIDSSTSGGTVMTVASAIFGPAC